jgi:carboxypeptidase Taq
MSAYAELEQRFARIAKIEAALSVLHWDQSVMMPAGGAAARGEQIATLRGLAHAQLVDPKVGELIERAGGESLDAWRSANLREMRHRYLHAAAVPGDLVEALSRAVTRCETVWRRARALADFAMLLPSLREVLARVRDLADAKAAALGVGPYDALLDQYDPGRRAADLDRIFGELEAFLPGFLRRVLDRQEREPRPRAPRGRFAAAAQRALAERLVLALGFDFEHGRLDVSLHPFSSGVPEDSRITTRYDDKDFASALMAALHETGHALYQQGLPRDWRWQPVGEDRGMTIHESQSLIVEMQACRSRAFVAYLAPLLRETFGRAGPAWEADNLHRWLTRVEPGFIRVDADEVTYPLHIVLRYRLETAMIEGRLHPSDLPDAWGDGMERLLGVRPPDDRLGCLQDIHWPDGAWGYFPTYTLGAIAAAQLFQAARAAEPGLLDHIGRGDFAPLVGWLRRNVHAKGSLLDSDGLLRAATGRPLDPAAFKRHLEQRYLA